MNKDDDENNSVADDAGDIPISKKETSARLLFLYCFRHFLLDSFIHSFLLKQHHAHTRNNKCGAGFTR